MQMKIEPSRVLVVDHERSIADSLTTILTLNGYEATAVYSGEEAVEAARELKPNVLISAIVMPGISGIETAVRIRQDVPDCRIVLCSGNPSSADLLPGAEAQGLQFELLPKPFHPRELLDRLAVIA